MFGGPPPEFVVTWVVDDVPPEALPPGLFGPVTLMLVWVWEDEPDEPPVCVFEPVDVPVLVPVVEPVVAPLPCTGWPPLLLA